jgi:tRNA(Ile)-lysidine synthase
LTAPSLITIARRALDGEAKLARGSTLLLAVSGGPDSMALLDVVARLAPKLGLGLFAHGVDHGLRADASQELDAAAAHAEKLDIPFGRTRVRVPRGGNLQARARAARWNALATAAGSCRASAIATAHQADDRAETVLIRLLRGAGPAGLAVLPPRAPLADTALELVRPLLRARRTDVMAHLARHRIPFANDPSNADARFVRTRVRREVLPLLAEIDPAVVDHLTALADDLAGQQDGTGGTRGLPRPTQRALAELLRSGSREAEVRLPGGLVVTRR